MSCCNCTQTPSEKQSLLDTRYLRMAKIWSENSYCERRKVGALIVKDKMIISDGYNGTPSGFENVCEDDDGKTKPYVLHAEANAILKVAKSSNSIKRVVYSEMYRLDDGVKLLERANIDVSYKEIS